MTTSSLLRHGVEHMTTLVAGLERWLEARNIKSLDRIRGKMRRGAMPNPTAFDRANYINMLSTSDLHRSRDLDL